MCNGFGCIVSNAGNGAFNIHFIEPSAFGDCSHSQILARLGWTDNQYQFNRKFVRIEYPDWTAKSFHFDEEYSLPAWAENSQQEIADKCDKLLMRVREHWINYSRSDKASYTRREKSIQAARDRNNSEVEMLIEEDRATLSDPSKTNEEKDDAHRVFRTKVYNLRERGYNEINAIVDKYAAIYLNAYARMVKRVSTITGYVPEK